MYNKTFSEQALAEDNKTLKKRLEVTEFTLSQVVSALAEAEVEILRLRNDNEELETERDAFRTTLASLDGKVREMMNSIDGMRRK